MSEATTAGELIRAKFDKIDLINDGFPEGAPEKAQMERDLATLADAIMVFENRGGIYDVDTPR